MHSLFDVKMLTPVAMTSSLLKSPNFQRDQILDDNATRTFLMYPIA